MTIEKNKLNVDVCLHGACEKQRMLDRIAELEKQLEEKRKGVQEVGKKLIDVVNRKTNMEIELNRAKAEIKELKNPNGRK